MNNRNRKKLSLGYYVHYGYNSRLLWTDNHVQRAQEYDKKPMVCADSIDGEIVDHGIGFTISTVYIAHPLTRPVVFCDNAVSNPYISVYC